MTGQLLLDLVVIFVGSVSRMLFLGTKQSSHITLFVRPLCLPFVLLRNNLVTKKFIGRYKLTFEAFEFKFEYKVRKTFSPCCTSCEGRRLAIEIPRSQTVLIARLS